MQKHTKIYLTYLGWPDFVLCEVCGSQCVDIHHVTPRSKFGKKTKHLQDDINNLIGLCRSCHDKAHRDRAFNDSLKQIALNRKY